MPQAKRTNMKKHIVQKARDIGFAACRVTTADPISSDKLTAWIDEGRHGGMRYMARDPKRRCDPRTLLPEARSVICCALAYGNEGLGFSDRTIERLPDRTSVARFARGADYHIVVREKLGKLVESIREKVPEAKAKICVDTSPILEKMIAARAGVGWIGKHTLLVNPDFGSWFVLGEIITDVELDPDEPVKNLCDACTECIDRCPTDALRDASLDARKCISYLTIECKDNADGDSYGCDVCQEVCPYNRTANSKIQIPNSK